MTTSGYRGSSITMTDIPEEYGPPGMRTFLERVARVVAKDGLGFEKSLIKTRIPPAGKAAGLNFNFLMSPEDPFHGYYQQKLKEYLSQVQEHGDIIDPDDVPSEITPAKMRNIIERAAFYLSNKGLEAEKLLKDNNERDENYGFLWPFNPFHAFYCQKLNEYRCQNQQDEEDTVTNQVVAQADLVEPPQFIVLPHFLTVRLPEGMNLKEFATLKLTAQFGAWYGRGFWLTLVETDGFEFTNQSDSRFPRFCEFVNEYSRVLMPPKHLEEELSKNDAYMATVRNGFLRLVQWDALGEMKWREGGVKSMIDWHASLERDLELQPLQTGTSGNPEPKRQNVDVSAVQGPPYTIRVSVANVYNQLVIEITVQSLSENVASLKEKIARKLQIPADTQKLSGEDGVLEDDNKSLLHYNVGAGDILSLSRL